MAGKVLRPVVVVRFECVIRVVDISHANMLEIRIQDVRAMVGACHPCGYHFLGRRIPCGDVLCTCNKRSIPCQENALIPVRSIGTTVAVEIVRSHVLAVRKRCRIECWIADEWRQTHLCALRVGEFDDPLGEGRGLHIHCGSGRGKNALSNSDHTTGKRRSAKDETHRHKKCQTRTQSAATHGIPQ